MTGSGKTEIYLRAVAEALARGRRALILVPEISITPQTMARFAARFPGRVAVLHSALSEGERYDTWRRARAGLVDVVVGPRSALFSPLSPLGLIVLDEEHDSSYKQEAPRPRYHAREAALELARQTGATVILGSATPSLESYYRAQRGEFNLLEMPRRIMGHTRRLRDLQSRYHVSHTRYQDLRDGPSEARYIPLPPVQIVDLRAELRAGNRSIFSRALQQAMDEALGRGEQVILFLNRRGTADFCPLPGLRRCPALPALRCPADLSRPPFQPGLPPLQPPRASARPLPPVREQAHPLLWPGHRTGGDDRARALARRAHSCAGTATPPAPTPPTPPSSSTSGRRGRRPRRHADDRQGA